MHYKPQVVTGERMLFYSKDMTFATKQEAIDYAEDLLPYIGYVKTCHAVESNEPVNYSYINGVLKEEPCT